MNILNGFSLCSSQVFGSEMMQRTLQSDIEFVFKKIFLILVRTDGDMLHSNVDSDVNGMVKFVLSLSSVSTIDWCNNKIMSLLIVACVILCHHMRA